MQLVLHLTHTSWMCARSTTPTVLVLFHTFDINHDRSNVFSGARARFANGRRSETNTRWNMNLCQQVLALLLPFQMFDQLWNILTCIFDFLLIIVRTLPRDIRGVYKLIRHSCLIKWHVFRQRDFIALFRSNVKRYQSKPCFIFEDTTLSFQQVRLD